MSGFTNKLSATNAGTPAINPTGNGVNMSMPPKTVLFSTAQPPPSLVTAPTFQAATTLS